MFRNAGGSFLTGWAGLDTVDTGLTFGFTSYDSEESDDYDTWFLTIAFFRTLVGWVGTLTGVEEDYESEFY